MEGSDVLIVIAEVAVAFAGFAGIVVIFRHRDVSVWAPQDVLRFRFMVECSLYTLAFALLPFILHHLGASPQLTWSSCSALLGALYAVNFFVTEGRARRAARAPGPKLHRGLRILFQAGTILFFVVLGLNTLGVGLERTFGPYLAALAWLLVISGVMFFRLLLAGASSSGSESSRAEGDR